MITLNQLVYDLGNIKASGVQSDDELLSPRQIKFWILNTRATLIRQDVGNKKRSISGNIIQSLGCVPVVYSDAAQCCGLSIGCSVLRTVNKIPRPIELQYRDLLTRIGPVDITKPGYSIIEYSRAPFISTKYNIPDAFYHNEYVFVLNPPPLIEYINIQGVFEDPTEAAKFTHCDGTQCYSDDDSFPISDHMVETMKQLIKEVDLKTIISVPTDYSGDAKGKADEFSNTR